MQILTTEAKNIFTDSDTFEILGLLIGILTLILAFIVSRKSIKNHLKTKQIDHVCSLIEYLNSTKISISFSTLPLDHSTSIDQPIIFRSPFLSTLINVPYNLLV